MYECTQNILAIWGNYDSVVYGRDLTAFHKMTSVELFYRALAGDGGSRAAHFTSRFSLPMLNPRTGSRMKDASHDKDVTSAKLRTLRTHTLARAERRRRKTQLSLHFYEQHSLNA
jgi:hypothetical protein